MSAEFRAGSLIQSRALATCLRAYREHGANAQAWAKVREVLHELYPEAHTNSIEAVIQIAQAGRLAGKQLLSGDGTQGCRPSAIPDARRLIRDAKRARRNEADHG